MATRAFKTQTFSLESISSSLILFGYIDIEFNTKQAFVKTFGFTYMSAGILKFLQDSLAFVQPQLLKVAFDMTTTNQQAYLLYQ